MPMYDYKCEKCKREYTDICRYEERDDERTCTCGGKYKRNVSGNQAHIYKGSGFYTTDYKGKR